MLKCVRRTQGGKGNEGMFIERDPKVFAAGIPTAQAKEKVAENLKHYLLKDQVDALIHDAVIPALKEPEPKPPKHLDMRNAGIFTAAGDLINPTPDTKFKALVKEFKNTAYASYWNKSVGAVRDPVPGLPEGCDILTKTMGTKSKFDESLYDIIMPKDPIMTDMPQSKGAGYQTDRNYCRPAYNPNNFFGVKSNCDNSGRHVKCCLTDDRVALGTSIHTYLCATQADFKKSNDVELGLSKSPNDNISCVPPGFAFGLLGPPENIPQIFTTCELNTGRQFFLKCLGHLNTLRKCLSKRVNAAFFRDFYLHLKYLDKIKSGWLQKEVVYDFCAIKYVRFNPSLIEPLLETWNAFNGTQIQYKTFVQVINYREPSPTLPKIQDVSEECIQHSTTYKDMVKPGQKIDERLRAGLPSGSYFDKDYPVIPHGYCKADTVYLTDESDAKACLNPSTLTLLGVSHRDMYAKRSPEVIRRIFESAGEFLTDENFNEIWDEAKKYHSQGWVSYATFKKALCKDRDETI